MGSSTPSSRQLGTDPQQGFSKPIGFVKAGSREHDNKRQVPGKTSKTDEELEQERKEARRCNEENSFRDVCSAANLFSVSNL